MYCLLIDDDTPTIDVLKDLLDWKKFGISKVESAHNIFDAQQLFEQETPDIIICDIEMPKGSGIDMIRWVRENHYDGAYIFFTCHERFEFASAAITYQADDYVTKPFDRVKLEASLMNASSKLRKRRMKEEYSRYGQNWLKNKDRVEQSFWRDVLFKAIPLREDYIHAELDKRELDISLTQSYRIALACTSKAEMEMDWDSNSFRHAFRNLSSEIVYGTIDHPCIISYQTDRLYYVAMILSSDYSADDIHGKLDVLINQVRKLLRCTVTCYWSEAAPIWELEKTKHNLEQIDRENMIFRGKVHAQTPLSYPISESYTLDVDRINDWFTSRQKLPIVNFLKTELHRLTIQNKLDLHTIRKIHHDFIQVAYSVLYKNNIQAHRLFADDATQQLEMEADSSPYNFMKWATYISNKTIDYLKEVSASEGVVEKVKRYIHEHYHEELNRDKLAEFVYLTPDYLAKRFKQETGLSIVEYLNEYRIRMAREMLMRDHASVSDIAMNTGFESISYFSTVFRKIMGCSPNAYRAKHKSIS